LGGGLRTSSRGWENTVDLTSNSLSHLGRKSKPRLATGTLVLAPSHARASASPRRPELCPFSPFFPLSGSPRRRRVGSPNAAANCCGEANSPTRNLPSWTRSSGPAAGRVPGSSWSATAPCRDSPACPARPSPTSLRALEACRVLTKVKRRVRLAWHQGGQQSRQATNAYVLHPPADLSSGHSESAGQTVPREIEIIHRVEPTPAAVAAAQEALARRRRSLEEQWLRRRSGGMAEA
jgi:hypothetical protein